MTETADPNLNPYGVRVRHTLEVKGVGTFETHLFPFGQAVDLLPWLLSLAAGPSGVVIELLRSALNADDLLAADVTGKTCREGVKLLADEIVRHGGHSKLIELLATTTLVPDVGQYAGQRRSCAGDFHSMFQGRPTIAAKVIGWVLEVQFSPFSQGSQFTSLAPLTQWLARWQQEHSKSPGDSTSSPVNGSSQG